MRKFNTIEELNSAVTSVNIGTITNCTAYINKVGWSSIKISDELRDKAFEEILDLLMKGAHNQAVKREQILFRLRNRPLNDWFESRIFFDKTRWVYIAGQDYTEEIKEIRNILLA